MSQFTPTHDRSVRPIRIAAIGDLHIQTHVPEHLALQLATIEDRADLLVLAGDLTEGGRIPEVDIVADLLARVRLPMVAVLGNHDRRGLRRAVMRRRLETSGVRLLDGEAVHLDLPGVGRIGVAGVSGTGGGFWPDESPDIVGARISQAVAIKSRREAARLRGALTGLDHQDVDATIVLMHFAPTVSTLGAEPPLKYWMLGNSLLGRVIDAHPVDLVLHGHAHLGNQIGETPGGTPVRNVAAQVTGGIVVYEVQKGRAVRTVTPGMIASGARPVAGGALKAPQPAD